MDGGHLDSCKCFNVGRESRVTFQNHLKITYGICASKSSANTRKVPLKVLALRQNTPVKYT